MKLGRYTRILQKHAFGKHMTSKDMSMLILLSEVMWMGINDLAYEVMYSRNSAIKGLKDLKLRGYVTIARQANGIKGLTRKYCISDKGRSAVQELFNKLNY